MIMKHQLLNPFKSPPFRVAVFLCSHLPWSWNSSNGYDVTNLLLEGRSGSVDFEDWRSAADSVPTGERSDAYLTDLPESIQQRIREKADSLDDMDIPQFRRFHPRVGVEKISMPTVHLYGVEDEYCKQSLALVELCEKSTTQVIEHPGGHEIPRDGETIKMIGNAIQRAVTRAELMM
jgi:hypothetical protein